MIKMIVTDLDDTLLKSDKTVSQYTKEVIKKAKEKGIVVIFATARGNSYKRFFEEDLFSGMVLMNGARTIYNGELIDEKCIDKDIYAPFLSNLVDSGLKVAAETATIHYSNINKVFSGSYQKYIFTDFKNFNGDKADKLYTYIEDEEHFKIIEDTLPKSLHIKRSRDGMIMIMNKEATKINGVLKIADKLNIKPDEIMAFGDDYNDIEMLKSVGHSVAMANAIPEVKKVAKYTTSSNNEDGVGKYINNLICCIKI